MSRYQVNRFMGGGCYALALFLEDRTGLQLMGLQDDRGVTHHAFVADLEEGKAYDARGEVEIENLRMFRGRRCAGQYVRPIGHEDLAEALRLTEPFSEVEIERFVENTPALSQLVQEHTAGQKLG